MPAFVEIALQQHINRFVPDSDDRLITTTRGHLLQRSHYDQDILKPAIRCGTPQPNQSNAWNLWIGSVRAYPPE